VSKLIDELGSVQRQVLSLLKSVDAADRSRQHHPDLSPLAWHAGHVAFIETYWVREVVLNDDSVTRPLHGLYFPERYPKRLRASALADAADVATFAAELFAGNRERLADLLEAEMRHPLLAKCYLPLFLIQHHAQHTETMRMVLHQHALQRGAASSWRTPSPLRPRAPDPRWREFDAGPVQIGNEGHDAAAFDNELPRHSTRLERYRLALHPVSNSEFLAFMEDGGYDDTRWWDNSARQWLQHAGARAPLHWRRDEGGEWFQIGETGPQALDPEAPVLGISRYEAAACCAWVGGRLPHECEWEHAMRTTADLRLSTGRAWEWCGNTFYPYPGFRAFPYERYSAPWFDERHYSLRGASVHTHPAIRRPTFRNFYTSEKRHIFAGARLAADA